MTPRMKKRLLNELDEKIFTLRVRRDDEYSGRDADLSAYGKRRYTNPVARLELAKQIRSLRNARRSFA